MPKDALPERYVVDRRGTPDPEQAQYYVLDVVHDRHARVALARLVSTYRRFGQHTSAVELEALLDGTSAAHAKVIQDQFEAKSASVKKASSTPARRRR